MRKMKIWLTFCAAAMAAPAIAQTSGMQGMDHSPMMQPTPANPYPPAEMRMQHAMMGAIGTDAAETWVRKMIEHHRGGIETSQIVLQHTHDPKVRQMARKTITEQRREVVELEAWLRNHGKRAE